MNISIIGSGAIGSAIANHIIDAGLEVMLANSRGPDSLHAMRSKLGPRLIPATVEQALSADLVILAVPFARIGEVAGRVKDWGGRIVVDTSNAIDFPAFTPTDLQGRPSTHVVAEQLPGARVVKAFNTLPAAVLSQDPRTNLGRRVLFVSGDDVDAVRVVEKLAEDIGFAVIALGAIAEGGLLQQFGGPLIVHNLIRRT